MPVDVQCRWSIVTTSAWSDFLGCSSWVAVMEKVSPKWKLSKSHCYRRLEDSKTYSNVWTPPINDTKTNPWFLVSCKTLFGQRDIKSWKHHIKRVLNPSSMASCRFMSLLQGCEEWNLDKIVQRSAVDVWMSTVHPRQYTIQLHFNKGNLHGPLKRTGLRPPFHLQPGCKQQQVPKSLLDEHTRITYEQHWCN